MYFLQLVSSVTFGFYCLFFVFRYLMILFRLSIFSEYDAVGTLSIGTQPEALPVALRLLCC